MAEFFVWLWRLVAHRRTRYVAAWVGVLALAAHLHHKAVHVFDSPEAAPEEKRRRDGNAGHVGIDFGGQWIMGRMLVLGHGRRLYDRHRLYEAAQRAYPWADEAPLQEAHDADELLTSFMDAEVDRRSGRSPRANRARATMLSFALPLATPEPLPAAVLVAAARDQAWRPEPLAELTGKHVGGPLYPPTQALIFAPLALDDDVRRAYRAVQWVMLGMGFVAGLGASALTRGRVWWPVAAAIILLYPGFTGGHELGQNGPASAAIVLWGWTLMARGRETAGGLVWGLLAFKPVWAAAFLLVPLLTRRWRAAAAMIGVGAAMAAATLPFVGVQSWLDWLEIGDVANLTYNVDGNWIALSRDLLGIPRRWLIDTTDPDVPYFGRDRWEAHVAGWLLLLLVAETTARLALLYPRAFRAATGPAAAFLLLGAWLSCFHFMYYDVLLSAVAYFAVLDPPAQIFRPKLVTFGAGPDFRGPDERAVDYFRPRLAISHPGLGGTGTGRTWVANSFLIYFGVALLIAQVTLPWLDLTISASAGVIPARTVMSAGEPVVRDGKTVMRTPKVEITTGTAGPPYDTFLLLFLWAWCGVHVVAANAAEAGRCGPVTP